MQSRLSYLIRFFSRSSNSNLRIAKKSKKANGVVNLMEEKYQDIALKMTPVEDIWGIGSASSAKLNQLGIIKNSRRYY